MRNDRQKKYEPKDQADPVFPIVGASRQVHQDDITLRQRSGYALAEPREFLWLPVIRGLVHALSLEIDIRGFLFHSRDPLERSPEWTSHASLHRSTKES